ERPLRARNQPVEDPLRIDRHQLPVKKIAVLEFLALVALEFFLNQLGVEQQLVFERLEKRLDCGFGDGPAQFFGRALRYGGEAGGGGQQVEDRFLVFSEAEVSLGDRILDDEDVLAEMLLRGEFEIGSESWNFVGALHYLPKTARPCESRSRRVSENL